MSPKTQRHEADPARREALKAALLARHGQRYPGRTARAHPWLPRLAMAGVLGAALLASFAAPAERLVEVGERLTIEVPGGGVPPGAEIEVKALLALVRQEVDTREIQVKARRQPAGGLSVQIDLWSGKLAAGAVERLRAGVPGLQAAVIKEEPLHGHMRTRFGLLLGRKLFGLSDDPAAIAQAKAKLQLELAARGEQGRVDIQVSRHEDGRREVRVEVEATKLVHDDGGVASPAPSGETAPVR